MNKEEKREQVQNNLEFACVNLDIQTDFKLLKSVPHPEFLMNQDAITQYHGIWTLFGIYIDKLQAKKVLEFGTRDGYSTQLFSRLLKRTNGHLWTVDLKEPKISEEVRSTLDNVTFLQMDVLNLDSVWKDYVDILYIDDWHNPYHLYEELDRFARFSKVILIHDIVQNWQTHEWLLPAIFSWCHKEFLPFYVYPLNPCGLVAIHREEFAGFYEYEK